MLYRWLMDTDGVLQNMFMQTKIKHAIADNGHNSMEHNILRLQRLNTIVEIIHLTMTAKTIYNRF